MKTRRRPRFRVILGITALFATLLTVAIGAEVVRNERLRSLYREQAARHERESRHLAEGSAEAAQAAESLRKIAERNRESAEVCLQNAETASVTFARQLWNERADEFRREAARVAVEADRFARLASDRGTRSEQHRRARGRYLAVLEGDNAESP